MTRRTKLDIINDMLVSMREKGGKIKPTHLMYKANLSHKLLNTYLDDLVSNEMVTEIKSKENYTYLIITDKGLEFLTEFQKMKEFQKSFGI
ncbi:MAG: winged helix-turn-helix domain-containing protein [Nanoarchaeota archaeon]|nr:winged helix-turn-helix domain-containing protein [Nanoarchaeota archaeon]